MTLEELVTSEEALVDLLFSLVMESSGRGDVLGWLGLSLKTNTEANPQDCQERGHQLSSSQAEWLIDKSSPSVSTGHLSPSMSHKKRG